MFGKKLPRAEMIKNPKPKQLSHWLKEQIDLLEKVESTLQGAKYYQSGSERHYKKWAEGANHVLTEAINMEPEIQEEIEREMRFVEGYISEHSDKSFASEAKALLDDLKRYKIRYWMDKADGSLDEGKYTLALQTISGGLLSKEGGMVNHRYQTARKLEALIPRIEEDEAEEYNKALEKAAQEFKEIVNVTKGSVKHLKEAKVAFFDEELTGKELLGKFSTLRMSVFAVLHDIVAFFQNDLKKRKNGQEIILNKGDLKKRQMLTNKLEAGLKSLSMLAYKLITSASELEITGKGTKKAEEVTIKFFVEVMEDLHEKSTELIIPAAQSALARQIVGGFKGYWTKLDRQLGLGKEKQAVLDNYGDILKLIENIYQQSRRRAWRKIRSKVKQKQVRKTLTHDLTEIEAATKQLDSHKNLDKNKATFVSMLNILKEANEVVNNLDVDQSVKEHFSGMYGWGIKAWKKYEELQKMKQEVSAKEQASKKEALAA